MWTALFWRGMAERAVKTFAQALIAVLGASGVGLLNANWVGAISAAGMAALLSVLTSLATPDTVSGVKQSLRPPTRD